MTERRTLEQRGAADVVAAIGVGRAIGALFGGFGRVGGAATSGLKVRKVELPSGYPPAPPPSDPSPS